MKFTNPNIDTTFQSGILHVKLLENSVLTTHDLQEIYSYGTKCSNALPYTVLFEAVGKYEVTEEALEYVDKNPHNIFVLAKADVMSESETSRKIRLHMIFDNPKLKPVAFNTANEAKVYLNEVLNAQDKS